MAIFLIMLLAIASPGFASSEMPWEHPTPNQDEESVLNYTVSPGGRFSVPFHLENNGSGLLEYQVKVEGLPGSFQPRIFLNGTEGDSIKLRQGESAWCAAVIQAPYLGMEGNYSGNISISSPEAFFQVEFLVFLRLPELEMSLDGRVTFSRGSAIQSGTIANDSPVEARDVMVTVVLGGNVAAQQRYENIPPGGMVSFQLHWAVPEGKQTAVIEAESNNGAETSVMVNYTYERESGISSETVILVGGVLALVFPIIVLAQMGIQKRKEKRAMEKRRRERDLSSALMTIDKEEED